MLAKLKSPEPGLFKTMDKIKLFIKQSKLARRLRLTVKPDLTVVLTVPVGFNMRKANEFIEQKYEWVIKSLNYYKQFEGRWLGKTSRGDYIKNRHAALLLAKQKVYELNSFYNFPHGRVSVKNQKTRWGSCSKKGNLNFNYKIIYLPEDVLNYLVVHELCHLREMNHSKKFWDLVAKAVPNYKALRSELKNFRT